MASAFSRRGTYRAAGLLPPGHVEEGSRHLSGRAGAAVLLHRDILSVASIAGSCSCDSGPLLKNAARPL